MRPSSRIDLAVFQLTPTRTRFDLVILANGRREKIASGLLDPFLSHLKVARDQMAIGGYSIELKPDPNSNVTWFTKGTLERFLRFVSTPEILERIDTLESEILEIEEAIVMQTNEKGGIPVDYYGKSVDNMEAAKPVLATDDDKAIVVYQPNSLHIEANWSTEHEGNPKIHLLKVLETRRSLLQKEKGMAFARAVAAGFDIDSMDMLISFSQCFGAARLMDACKRYLDLWKKKHESEQWLEIEAAEEASVQLDIMAMNASGTDASNRHLSTHESNAEKPPTDNALPASQPEHFQGQYPNPIFPPWQFQSPPGMPHGYQPYPTGPMPYCPNYPANTQCLQPAFSPMQDQSKNGRASCHKRSCCDDKESTSESEASDKDFDGNYSDELHKKEATVRRKKSSSSGKKKSGVVVIRNINYISSKEQNRSDGEAHSASRSGRENTDTRTGTLAGNGNFLLDKNEASYDNEVDGGHWQAFQNYLLKENKEEDTDYKEMFLMGKAGNMKRHQERANNDPLAVGEDDVCQYEEDYTDIEQMNGSATFRRRASGDELLSSRTGDQQGGRNSFDGLLDAKSNSVNRRTTCRRTDPDDSMLQGRDVIYNFSPSDIYAESKHRTAHKDSTTGSSDKPNDDAYIVSLRSNSLEMDGMGRQSLDIDSEFPWISREISKASKNVQPNYEPDYMSLMPERETERGSSSYNPAIDYELDAQRLKEAVQNKSEEPAGTTKDQGPKKEPKDKKMKLIQDVPRKGKPTKLSPLDEARVRAERMRSYKADLQKAKKEKEEEQQRRLEALKIERQKRIAAWSSSIPGQSSRQLSKQQLPNKLSPISKPSKFTDTEPGPSSPLQRSSRKTVAVGPIEPQKLSTVKQSPGSRLSHSVPSLPEELRGSSGTKLDAKASMARIRRLSEPKMTTDSLVPSVKPQSTEAARRQMSNKSDRKIMSAIIRLDRSKAATLPELNIKASKPSDASQGNLAARMNSQTVSGNEQDSPRHVDDGVPYSEDADDFSVTEKNVVTELEKPSASPQPCSLQVNQQPPSAPDVVEGDMTKVPEQIHNHKFKTYNLEASPSIMKTNSTEKHYQAPYARISSVEDPYTNNSEYCKLPPACLDIRNEGNETAKVCISDLQESPMRKQPETVEKQSKESLAKGLKRLLKFGKKSSNSASSECIGVLDDVSVGDSETDDHASHTHATNKAVYTLKNLLSQDETPTAATNPKKSSRSFSLLSPFRKKSSEKKCAT